MSRGTIRVLTLAALLGACAAARPESVPAAGEDVEMSAISGDPDAPRRHFRLRHAARLTPERAAEIYEIVRSALALGYARSGLEPARSFPAWRRYNARPYLSSTHGNHYLSNYANDLAARYGCTEEAGRLAVGSVIAKDSFAVTESGGILLGPLFLMEKMPEGFNYVSGDWRYTMVLPDGSVLGTTRGAGAERVQYCIGCHLTVEQQDHLFFVPAAERAGNCP